MAPMGLGRINPVVLVTGAAAGVGATCARALAREAEGGLILVDADEPALAAAADALDAPPERVSTLAIDVMDVARWGQATEFISGQYGRLDFAIINTIDGSAVVTDRRFKRGAAADIDAALLSLRALTPLMRANVLGGGVVVITPAAALDDLAGGLLPFMRAAANQAAADTINVNAIAVGRSEITPVRRAPLFADMTSDAGGERAALEHLMRLPTPLACAPEESLTKLALALLAAPVTAITLVVDAPPDV